MKWPIGLLKICGLLVVEVTKSFGKLVKILTRQFLKCPYKNQSTPPSLVGLCQEFC